MSMSSKDVNDHDRQQQQDRLVRFGVYNNNNRNNNNNNNNNNINNCQQEEERSSPFKQAYKVDDLVSKRNVYDNSSKQQQQQHDFVVGGENNAPNDDEDDGRENNNNNLTSNFNLTGKLEATKLATTMDAIENKTTTSVNSYSNFLETRKDNISSTGSDNNRQLGAGKLSVVIPTAQKSLLTPTIITTNDVAAIGRSSGHFATMACGGIPSAVSTPIQLFNSLVQLNGQDVSLFTGLPSCTPTSADALAGTGNLSGINPFFYGVTSFNQQGTINNSNNKSIRQQHNNSIEQQNSIEHVAATNSDASSTTITINNQQQQLHHPSIESLKQNSNQINGGGNTNVNLSACFMEQHQQDNNIHNNNNNQQQQEQNTMLSSKREPRRQLSKLSLDHLQAANAMMLSPLLLSLSPEQENWLRQLGCFNQRPNNINNSNNQLQNNQQGVQGAEKTDINPLMDRANSDCGLNRAMNIDDVNAVAYHQHHHHHHQQQQHHHHHHQQQQQQQQQQQHFHNQIAAAQAAREFSNQMATIHIHNHHQQQQHPNQNSLLHTQHLITTPGACTTSNSIDNTTVGNLPTIGQQVASAGTFSQQTTTVATAGHYGTHAAPMAAHDRQQQQISNGFSGASAGTATNLPPLSSTSSTTTSSTTTQSISNKTPTSFYINHQNPQAFQTQTLISRQNQISTLPQANCLINNDNQKLDSQQQHFSITNGNFKQQQIDFNNNNNNIAAINHRIPISTFNSNGNSNNYNNNNINNIQMQQHHQEPPAAHTHQNIIHQTIHHNGNNNNTNNVFPSPIIGSLEQQRFNNSNDLNNCGANKTFASAEYNPTNNNDLRQMVYIAHHRQQQQNNNNNDTIIQQYQQNDDFNNNHRMATNACSGSSGSAGVTGSGANKQSFTTLAMPVDKTNSKDVLFVDEQQKLLTSTRTITSPTPTYTATSETLSVKESISSNNTSTSSSRSSSFINTNSPQRSTSISSSSYDTNTMGSSSVNASPSLIRSNSVSRDTTINVEQILTTTTTTDSKGKSKNTSTIELMSGKSLKESSKQDDISKLLSTKPSRPSSDKKIKKIASTKLKPTGYTALNNKTSAGVGGGGACLLMDSNGDISMVVKKKSKGGRKKKLITDEEMVARKNRSKERNRVAAKRCRQKRKQFLDELRGRIENLNDINRKLQKENTILKSELDLLKQTHKSCRI